MKTPRSTLDYLDDILDAAGKIEIFTRGMSYEEFAGDDKTVYAVTRALEVIGEATKCIPRQCDVPVERSSNTGGVRSGKGIPRFPGAKWPVCVTS